MKGRIRIRSKQACELTIFWGSRSAVLKLARYGGHTAGMFGYSHFTVSRIDSLQSLILTVVQGGFAGGQAEYVRVPYGDVNLLKLPNDVPDEKGLFLSDVLSTSWNCVVDTGVKKDDVVAIWGAGPIGQMCADFAFLQGAKRVIVIDQNWRLDYIKSKIPKVETIDYSKLPRGTTITSKLKEMVHEGPDVALECVAGEYPKGWAHYFELLLGAETDTSEIVNEMITSVKSFGRCGITVRYLTPARRRRLTQSDRGYTLASRTTSTLAPSWSVASDSSAMVRRRCICQFPDLKSLSSLHADTSQDTGRTSSRRYKLARSSP